MRQTTVVLPCLNEAETLAGCIVEAQQSYHAGDLHGSVVVADNGSTDASTTIAMEHNARVVHVPGKGYGSALRGGIEACDSEYIVMGDADGSYDFGDLPKFIAGLDEGFGRHTKIRADADVDTTIASTLILSNRVYKKIRKSWDSPAGENTSPKKRGA